MFEWFDRASPRTMARITGVIYFLYFVLAIAGSVFLQQAGISTLTPNGGDPARLGRDILGHQDALQAGVAIGLVSVAFYVAVTAMFYLLFRPVSRTIALLGLSFGLVAMAVSAFGAIFELGPLAVLQSTSSGLSDAQRQGFALQLLQIGDKASPISLLFSGLFQVAFGYLMFRSGFLPRFLGVLVAAAGVGWFLFLVPPLANALLTELEVLGFLGEAPLMLWLLIMGVNSDRWTALAAAAGGQAGV